MEKFGPECQFGTPDHRIVSSACHGALFVKALMECLGLHSPKLAEILPFGNFPQLVIFSASTSDAGVQTIGSSGMFAPKVRSKRPCNLLFC